MEKCFLISHLLPVLSLNRIFQKLFFFNRLETRCLEHFYLEKPTFSTKITATYAIMFQLSSILIV